MTQYISKYNNHLTLKKYEFVCVYLLKYMAD